LGSEQKGQGFVVEVDFHLTCSFLVVKVEGCRHRRASRGGGGSFPGLNNQGKLFFRASATCSKILNDKKIFENMKNFRATLFFRESTSFSKILNDEK